MADVTRWSTSGAESYLVENAPHVAEIKITNRDGDDPFYSGTHTLEIEGHGPVTFTVDVTPNHMDDPRDTIRLTDWPVTLYAKPLSIKVNENGIAIIKLYEYMGM